MKRWWSVIRVTMMAMIMAALCLLAYRVVVDYGRPVDESITTLNSDIAMGVQYAQSQLKKYTSGVGNSIVGSAPERKTVYSFVMYVFYLLAFVLITSALAYSYYLYYKFKIIVGIKMDALAAAGYDLVKLMEQALPDGWKSRRKLVAETMKEFAITGMATVEAANSSMINLSKSQTPEVYHQTAEKVTERWLTDQRSFLSSRGGVRSGVQIFTMLFVTGNIQGAFIAMINHMKAQLTKRDWDNIPNLKMVFDIGDDVPTTEMIDMVKKADLTKWQYFVIGTALKWGRKEVFKHLVYYPPVPQGKEPIVIRGENILKSMRVFLSSGDTYDERLASKDG